MTNVVALRVPRKLKRSAPERDCEILFFTGVRYARPDDTPKVKPAKPARPKKRRA